MISFRLSWEPGRESFALDGLLGMRFPAPSRLCDLAAVSFWYSLQWLSNPVPLLSLILPHWFGLLQLARSLEVFSLAVIIV